MRSLTKTTPLYSIKVILFELIKQLGRMGRSRLEDEGMGEECQGDEQGSNRVVNRLAHQGT